MDWQTRLPHEVRSRLDTFESEIVSHPIRTASSALQAMVSRVILTF